MFNKECGEYALRSSGINHWGHENRGNNHQLKKRLIVRQILLVISIGKEWKKVGRIFIKMFWDRGSRENSINNPLLGGRDTCIYGGFGWLPLPPPLSPPPPVCFFLSKQLTIFRLQKQVITLSLIECDPLFGKSQLRPRILDYVPVW